MEPEKQIEIQDSSSIQQQPCNNNNNNLRKTCSEIDIDIEDETPTTVKKDRPLPIYLKFVGVEYKARIKQIPSKNAVNVLVSKVGLKMNGMEQEEIDDKNNKYKQILKGITGSICPGEILALMGPSGSGKTTLLKIIGGRLKENVKGSITYNDIPYNPALKRRIGFVTQDDVLFPQLTVEETLIFSAILRLSSSMSRCQKYQKVDMIIKELGLERCRHTQIGGGFLRGLSGGERKRTSIAYEILVDPSLLLLDEPTSGLDSSSANKLLQILQGVAQAGRTIITTIHQPSSRMFHTFNKVLLISEGCPIYHGEARRAMDYFSSLRFIPDIAMNPAEFLLDLATGQVKDISIPEVLTAAAAAAQGISPEYERLVIRYLQEEFKVQLDLDLDPVQGGERNGICHQMVKAPEHLQSAIQIKKDRTSTWLDQFMVLSKRTFRMRYREYFDVFRLVQALGVSVLLGLLWWKSNPSTEAQLRDQVGLMFYICIFWTYTSIFEAMFVFPAEKLYLVKERKADMYRLSVYYVCSTMCDLVAHLLNPTLFTSILYFMTGLKRTPQCFFLTLAAVLLISITSHGAGELSGAAVMSIKRTGTLASSVLMLFLLTGGYYVQHMPVFMEWLRYISFMHYGYKLLLKVQYSGDDLYECESKGGCRKLQTSPTFSTVNLNGGLQEVWILLAMAIGYRMFAYICLRHNINGFHL